MCKCKGDDCVCEVQEEIEFVPIEDVVEDDECGTCGALLDEDDERCPVCSRKPTGEV